MIADLKDRLRGFLRRGNNSYGNLLRAVLDGGQAVHDAVVDFAEATYPLQTAPLWWLNMHWGPWLNVPQSGMSETLYRRALLVKRRLNRATGNVPGLLVILRELLPAATQISWTMVGVKTWTVTIAGVPLASVAEVMNLLRKRPSPEGGGYSVAGDRGVAVASDLLFVTFSSSHGAVTHLAGFASAHGPVPADIAGFAAASEI